MIPPKAFMPRFSLGNVALFVGTGPVAAAKYGIVGFAKAVALTFIGPSEAGVAIAVGVTPRVELKATVNSPAWEELAIPESKNSRKSMICVPAPPFTAIHCVAATLKRVGEYDVLGVRKTRFAMLDFLSLLGD